MYSNANVNCFAMQDNFIECQKYPDVCEWNSDSRRCGPRSVDLKKIVPTLDFSSAWTNYNKKK